MVSSKGVEPKIKFTGYKVKKLTYGMQRLKSVLISEESITKKGN